jgi:hypothetical protein
MKPAEVALAMRQFAKEVDALDGDGLLDKWIAFKDSAEAQELDLGLQKSLYLESALVTKFGLGGWRKAVESRMKAPPDA